MLDAAELDRLEQEHTVYGNPVTNRQVRAVIVELRASRRVVEAAQAWNEARKAINDRSHPDHLKWSRTGMEILPLTQALDDALSLVNDIREEGK